MLSTCKALLLRAIPYGETSTICTFYTKELGTASFILKGIRKKKGRHNIIQPLFQLELSYYPKKSGQNLSLVKDFQLFRNYTKIPFDVSKSSILLFLTEILQNTLKEEQHDPELFDFISEALVFLDQSNAVPNFHLIFMLKLCKYLGAQPILNFCKTLPYFHKTDAQFINSFIPLETLDLVLSKQLADLSTCSFSESAQLQLTQTTRKELLNELLNYYIIHIPGFRKPQSLAVLTRLFED